MRKTLLQIVIYILVYFTFSSFTLPNKKNSDGVDDATLIIITYPEEIVSATEALYSKLLPILGMGKNGQIKAGHTGLILIKDGAETFEYYDNGRYISPIGYSRVRGANTDPSLKIEISAKWHGDDITNVDELLMWMHNHPDCPFGIGPFYASVVKDVNYRDAKDIIDKYQTEDIIPYGPFVIEGVNCSRFVAKVTKKSVLNKRTSRKLNNVFRITPSCLGNIRIVSNGTNYYIAQGDSVYTSNRNLRKIQRKLLFDGGDIYTKDLIGNIEEPIESKRDTTWQWLSGKSGGAWFEIKKTEQPNIFSVAQYNSRGELQFNELYKSEIDIQLIDEFRVTYPSHFKHITIYINNQFVKLLRLE